MVESDKIMVVDLTKDYSVAIIEEDDSKHVYYNEKEYQIGLFEPIEQNIYLYSKMTNGLKWQTLAHELTHAFLFIAGLQNVAMNEETICNFTANYHERITEIVNEYKDKAERYYANKDRDKEIH